MTWTNTGGGDHEGENWTPTNNTAISGIHTNIGIFTIQTENTIYVASTTWAKWITYDELHIYAVGIDIIGTLYGSSRGYRGGGEMSSGYGAGGGRSVAGGAGYGGHGGNSVFDYSSGPTYGSSTTEDIERGSGGGGGYGSGSGTARYGGTGGGGIGLHATSIDISGAIYCNGGAGGASVNAGAGGGSGGGILLIGSIINLSGILSANGAIGSRSDSGVGGGGRIKLFYFEIDLTGSTITVTKGISGKIAGSSDGTIYYEQQDTLAYLASSIIIF